LATPEDLDGMMRIEELCFGDGRFDIGTVMAYITRKDAFAVVATSGEGIAGAAMGMVSTRLDCGRVASVAVLRSHRGRGLGRELLAACEKEFHRRGVRRFMLEVAVDNDEAVKLYEACGYQISAVIEGYYSSGKDAYIMEKNSTMEGRRVKVKVRPS
jgi:ribosomal protein S18 acetylase RimI-like enzyme